MENSIACWIGVAYALSGLRNAAERSGGKETEIKVPKGKAPLGPTELRSVDGRVPAERESERGAAQNEWGAHGSVAGHLEHCPPPCSTRKFPPASSVTA